MCVCMVCSEYSLLMCVPVLADREVQRILLELLNQMDGFDQNVNVKVSVKYMWVCEPVCAFGFIFT